MLRGLHTHLSGKAVVEENYFFSDRLKFKKEGYSLSQFFFKPYDSKEFVHCARHTFSPLFLVGLGVILPTSLLLLPLAVAAAIAVTFLISEVMHHMNMYRTSDLFLNISNEVLSQSIQTVIDLVVLPVSLIVLATRGISTALKAVDLYDHDSNNDLLGLVPY